MAFLWLNEWVSWWWIVLGILLAVNLFLLVELMLAWRTGRRLKNDRRRPN